MDYFPVIITTMPINSETGQLYIPDGLIDLFRRNINDFVKLNGGNSNRFFLIKEKPDWDKVDEILMGNRLRSNLGCN